MSCRDEVEIAPFGSKDVETGLYVCGCTYTLLVKRGRKLLPKTLPPANQFEPIALF